MYGTITLGRYEAQEPVSGRRRRGNQGGAVASKVTGRLEPGAGGGGQAADLLTVPLDPQVIQTVPGPVAAQFQHERDKPQLGDLVSPGSRLGSTASIRNWCVPVNAPAVDRTSPTAAPRSVRVASDSLAWATIPNGSVNLARLSRGRRQSTLQVVSGDRLPLHQFVARELAHDAGGVWCADPQHGVGQGEDLRPDIYAQA
jgi:hypothetical protein